jgi:hypothetical protein
MGSPLPQVQTLDVGKQLPGPKWTMRQWCLYWKERLALPPPPEPHHGPAPARAGGSDAPRVRGSAAPAPVGGAGVSSADDGANTEMDDEADSAFVHQGYVCVVSKIDQHPEVTTSPESGSGPRNHDGKAEAQHGSPEY